MKILFLVPYPTGEAASQRFRFEHFYPVLELHGIYFEVQSFLPTGDWKMFFKPGNWRRKIIMLFKGIAARFQAVYHARSFDYIFIHREAAPLGPPLLEGLIALQGCRIIYDFDDAIWLADDQESLLKKVVKSRYKVAAICRWSHKISCGNHYLETFARRYNSNTFVVPTVINPNHHRHPPHSQVRPLTIGWTGSHSTLKYLSLIEPALQKLAVLYPQLRFLIIADQPPALALPNLVFVPWTKQTEVSALASVDIGIMPLPDDEWSKGKCGFKILQYMAIGIPTIASPVGANEMIIQHMENGLLARNNDEWVAQLISLVDDPELRQRIGQNGKLTLMKNYTVDSITGLFLSLFSE